MSRHFGTPGIGGSLGVCALCGKSFLTEIVLGSAVKSFSVSGCDQTLYGHDKCLAKTAEKNSLDVLNLPPESPLRQAYEKMAVT